MWSRNTALLLAVGFTAGGLLGFVPALLTPLGDEAPLTVEAFGGRLFGLFPVNVLHDLIHLGFALWGFFAYFSGVAQARMYLRSVGVVYIVLAVAGFIPGLDSLFGLVPLDGDDIWLHGLIGIIAAGVGFLVTDTEPVGQTRRQI